MISRTADGTIVKDYNDCLAIRLEFGKGDLEKILVLFKSLCYGFFDSFRIQDLKSKDHIVIKYGDSQYLSDKSELTLSTNEMGLIEKLILDYINDAYFLGLHLDIEISTGNSHIDLTISINID